MYAQMTVYPLIKTEFRPLILSGIHSRPLNALQNCTSTSIGIYSKSRIAITNVITSSEFNLKEQIFHKTNWHVHMPIDIDRAKKCELTVFRETSTTPFMGLMSQNCLNIHNYNAIRM